MDPAEKEELQKYRLEEALRMLPSTLFTREDLQKILQLPLKQSEKFVDALCFYAVSKDKDSFIKLIMIVSCVETITADKEHITFERWLVKEDSAQVKTKVEALAKKSAESANFHEEFKSTINALSGDYYTEYGSNRKVRDFFEKNLTTTEKVGLISALCLKNDESHPEDDTSHKTGIFPKCYEREKCMTSYGNCDHTKGQCMLFENEPKLKETLKTAIDFIYDLRSKFVHEATFPEICDKGVNVVPSVHDGKIVKIRLNIEQMEKLFEESFKRYLNREIEPKN